MLPLQESIGVMTDRFAGILRENAPSVYLFGSTAVDDFKLGWSDIDILCLTQHPISRRQAEQLINLRQELGAEHPGNPYYCLFEGGFLTLQSLIERSSDTVVYWGTSGQRITDHFALGAFSIMELLDSGVVLSGHDVRHSIKYPTDSEIQSAVLEHYNVIRKYAATTKRSLYSAGWLLDIARCLYTLEAGKIIAKTQAGEWALANGLVPDVDVMKRVIEIRKEPERHKTSENTMAWLETLGDHIQRFADVLETELYQSGGRLIQPNK